MKSSLKIFFLFLFTFTSIFAFTKDLDKEQQKLILGHDSRVPVNPKDQIAKSIGFITISTVTSEDVVNGVLQTKTTNSGCTGAVINRKYVLSVAHCFVDNNNLVNLANVTYYPSLNMHNFPAKQPAYSTRSRLRRGSLDIPETDILHTLRIDYKAGIYIPKEYMDYQKKCQGDYVSLEDHDLCFASQYAEELYDVALFKLKEEVPYGSYLNIAPYYSLNTISSSRAIGYPIDLEEKESLSFVKIFNGDWATSIEDFVTTPAFETSGTIKITTGGKRFVSKEIDLAMQMSGGPWLDRDNNIIGVSSIMARRSKENKETKETKEMELQEGKSFNYARALDREMQDKLTLWMAKNP